MGCSRWGNYNIGNNRVCAFDGATGAKRWEVATASWIYSSAAIGVDGTVYIASEDAKVLALNGATGAQRWAFTPNTGFMCSPAIGADNTIYIGAGDGKLRALDGATGTKRWEFTTGGSIQSSAAIAADGTLYFGSNDRKVYALSSSSLGGPASSPWPMFCQNARRTGRVETGSPTAPLITAQPQSRTNSVGTTATFSVTATGTESLSYQWRRDSVNLSDGSNVVGATTPTLTLANVQPADAANYQVVVANASGSVTSAVATLTVIVPPAITGQPQSRTNIAGTTAAFSVTATGTAPLSYQWLKNGVNLASGGSVSGATSASLTLANVQPMDAANYQVVVANAAGSVTSAVATLTISPAVPGTKRWEFATGDVITSSPAIGADGTVYVGSGDRKLYALDGATGAKRWEFATGSAVVNCPAIGVDGMVYVGSQDGKCYALDEATGQQRWAFATGGEVNSSPAIGSDGTVYVGSLDGKLYALNGATGAKRWEFLTGNQIHSSPAIGADGTVYIGAVPKARIVRM
jgi:outer membrane protein assembly factor BamB